MSQTAFLVCALALFPAFACFALFFTLLAHTRGQQARREHTYRLRTLEIIAKHLFAQVDDIITLVGRIADRDRSTLPVRQDDLGSHQDLGHCVNTLSSTGLRQGGPNRLRSSADACHPNRDRAFGLDDIPVLTISRPCQNPTRTNRRSHGQPRNNNNNVRHDPEPSTNDFTSFPNRIIPRSSARVDNANGYAQASSSTSVRSRQTNNTTPPHPTTNPPSPSPLTATQESRLIDDLVLNLRSSQINLSPPGISAILTLFTNRLHAFIDGMDTSATLNHSEFSVMGAYLEHGLYQWLYLGEVVPVTRERAMLVLESFRRDWARLWQGERGAATVDVVANDMSNTTPPLSRSTSPTHSSHSSSTSSNLSGTTLVESIDLSLSGATLVDSNEPSLRGTDSSTGSNNPLLVGRHYSPAPARFIFDSAEDLEGMANDEVMGELRRDLGDGGEEIEQERRDVEQVSGVQMHEDGRVSGGGNGNLDGQVWMYGAGLLEYAARQARERES